MVDNKFVVRLFDGFDYEWMDVSGVLSIREAEEVLAEKTNKGTRNTHFNDIDYYRIFAADTRMVYDGKR